MTIAPSTIIRLLKNVPLSDDYRDTIYFGDSSSQSSYFSGLAKFTLTENSYQRYGKGVLRVEKLADDIYDCNYMMFQNENFGGKWFYAFITRIEYVNNVTSEIYYELDVLQTWLTSLTFKPCYVEREMIVNDVIGYNLIPENLETGDYIYTKLANIDGFKNYKIAMLCSFDKDLKNARGGYYGGVYSGLIMNVFDTVSDANAFIKKVTDANKSTGISSIFMLPNCAYDDTMSAGAITSDIARAKRQDSIASYTPKNKKVLTYPYNFMYVTNGEGTGANYEYECFGGDSCNFKLVACMTANPEIMLVPKNFRGVAENYNFAISVSNFPQCSWSIDTYKQWLANNRAERWVGYVETGLKTVADVATLATTKGAEGVDATISDASNIAHQVAQRYDRSTLPSQAHGTIASSALIATREKGFQFYQVQIREQFAKIIDDYFDMYGYATHRVKVPNRTSRPHWNYVKTVGCNCVGSVPAEHLAKIRRVHDNGVTYWKKGSEVGNYTLNNH